MVLKYPCPFRLNTDRAPQLKRSVRVYPGMAQIDGSRLSIGWCCVWYAVIFVGYMLCVFCLHELHVYEHTPAKYASLLIIGPLLLIWVGYWAVLVASPYLRPRSILRHCG